MKRILIVEDDRTLSDGIVMMLGSDNLQIEQCYLLRAARKAFAEAVPDLLILDINLPDGNGLDFLKELRKSHATPVILLTANDMETDIVAGLEWGADDYVTKPFSLAVLRARVNNQLRRSIQMSVDPIRISDYTFDFVQMVFLKGEQEIELSKTEQKLLRLLVLNRGATLTRADLIDRIWTAGAEYVDENALSVTIKRLRDKLEDIPAKPQFIKTVYGIGYTWKVT